jgi:type II secretory pathway component GspD/PulD (secretin)
MFSFFKRPLVILFALTVTIPAYAQEPGVKKPVPVKVAPPDAPTTGSSIVTRLYAIKYATPAELAKIVTDLMPAVKIVLGPQPKFVRDTPAGETLGSEATVSQAIALKVKEGPSVNIPDQFVRNLILRGTAKDVAEAIETLNQIDLPAPQVLIEAKIVDMTEGTAQDIGVSWDFAPSGTTARFKLGSPASPNEGKEWPQVIFGRLTRDIVSFNATLEAAVRDNKARILASPRLMVLYNQRARIFIGDEVTYLLGTASSINGQTLQTGRVNVGVELNVVATSNSDGTINLKINPEIGSLLQLDTLANGISLPRIARRTLATAIRIRDGDTIILGGLNSSVDTKTTRKIPILGDLPILGQFFRRESKNITKSEIVMFLRASVVTDDMATVYEEIPEVKIPLHPDKP